MRKVKIMNRTGVFTVCSGEIMLQHL